MRKSFLIILLLLGLGVLLGSKAANADGYDNNVIAAADIIIEQQNSDGGWPWVSGSKNSAVNVTGVSGRILLDAYNFSKNEQYITSAIAAANFIVENGVIYGPDGEFLIRLQEILDRDCLGYEFNPEEGEEGSYSNYAEFAAWAWANIKESHGDAAGYGRYIRDKRSDQGWDGLWPWDGNSYVRTLKCLDQFFPGNGYDGDAMDIKDVMLEDAEDKQFDPYNDEAHGYLYGLAGLIGAIVATDPDYVDLGLLVDMLKGYQQKDGSFVDHNDTYDAGLDFLTTVQTTAYCARALRQVENMYDTTNQIDLANEYLASNQDESGGWIDGEYQYPEINSEAARQLGNIFPQITNSSPEDGEEGVVVDIEISIEFSSEQVGGEASLEEGGEKVDADVAFDGNTLRMNPSEKLGYSSSYTRKICVYDEDFNLLKEEITFVTESAPLAPAPYVPPVTKFYVTDTSPKNGEETNDARCPITVKFNINVDTDWSLATDPFYFVNGDGEEFLPTGTYSGFYEDGGGKKIIFTPSDDWPNGEIKISVKQNRVRAANRAGTFMEKDYEFSFSIEKE